MSLPQPRALPQILGGMVDDYLSRLDSTGIAPGVQSLRVGSSILAMLEGVGQSQAHNSQDLMNVLNADDIDHVKGARLDRIGRTERVPRRGETYASGSGTVTDTRYTRTASKVYPGKPAPLVGAGTIYVSDASAFPSTGQVYIGRGTSNYEGPLSYSAKAAVVSGLTTLYWTLTITGGTLRSHNSGESVVLAQGGNRTISVGQVVGTPQGSVTDAVLYSVTQQVTLQDGEVELDGVSIVAQLTGNGGNQNSGAIRVVTAPAFTGMAFTNPLPISNGLPVEDDDHYRARIKAVRANRSKGTPDALMSRAYGVQSPSEDATVVSAQLAVLSGSPSTLFIDDGAAYEEKDDGVSYEVLIDSANGGETTFYLEYGRPVARAMLTSQFQAPFALSSGARLSISVGGTTYTHNFPSDDFADITNANAYEVVASINANSNIGFNAHTTLNGTGVAVFSRRLANEDLTLVQPAGSDASVALGLPQGRVDTLRLYKNDGLLFKDGMAATIVSMSRSSWAPLATGETLLLNVDGTDLKTYIFVDADFVNAQTGFTTVAAAATVDAWVAVLNAKLPGCTAAAVGSTISITSNRGATAAASLVIDPTSTLVTKGVFSSASLSAAGRAFDYTLDRNLGVVKLQNPLSKGDRLTAGTPFTRAYLQSTNLGTGTVTISTAATMWFVVDGAPTSVTNSLDATQTLTLTTSATTPIRRVTSTSTATAGAAYPFKNVKLGDWFFVTDPTTFQTSGPTNYNSGFYSVGAWRVSNVDTLGQWFEYESPSSGSADTATNVGTAYAKVKLVRTPRRPQKVTIPGGQSYAPQDIVDTLNYWLQGAQATLYQTLSYRVGTNSFGPKGDITLVAQTASALPLGLALGTSVNDLPHYASVESGNSEIGAPPIFANTTLTASSGWTDVSATKHLFGGSLQVTLSSTAGEGSLRRGSLPLASFLHPFQVRGTVPSRWGTDSSTYAGCSSFSGSNAQLDNVYDPPITGTYSDRVLFAGSYHLGPESMLNVVLDNDESQVFGVNMFRRLVPVSSVPYGTGMQFLDADNPDQSGNPQPLKKAFGTGFDFSNFCLYSHPRGVTHSSDSTKSVLWRLSKFWNGEVGTVRYSAPTAPGATVAVTVVEPNFDINIQLPSGSARALRLGTNSQMRAYATSDSPNQVAVMVGFIGMTLSRSSSTVICTPTLPPSVVGHGYTVGQTIYLTSTDPANFPSGSKTITSANATTFQWTESGTTVSTTSYGTATITWPNDNTDFVTGGVVAGDYVSFDGNVMASVKGAYKVISLGHYYVKFLKFAANTPADNLWHAATAPGTNILAYPVSFNAIGTSVPTASSMVTAVNALANPIITGVLGGAGTGLLNQASVEEAIGGTDPSAPLQEGFLVISNSLQNSTDYTFTAKYSLPSVSAIDWANEQFRLVPTTAKNVTDFINVPSVSGLSVAGAGLMASSHANRIQLSSGTLGSGGSIQVDGGSANALSFPIRGSATNYGNLYVRVNIPASSDVDSGLTQGMAVSIDAAQLQPKVIGWDGSSSFASSGGKVSVTAAVNAWKWSASRTTPVFGGNYYFEQHGRFACLTCADGAHTFSDVPIDDWLTVTDATGNWTPGAAIAANPRYGSCWVKLADGRYMVMGGCSKYSDSAAASLSGAALYTTVDIWDPSNKAWSTTAALPAARAWGAAAVLADGRVVYCGGISDTSQNVSNATYIWTPGTGLWTTSGSLTAARARHTATTMGDGKVLAIGGHSSAWAVSLNSMESFNPTGSWTNLSTSTLPFSPTEHTTIPFGYNRLLVIWNNTACAMFNYPSPTWSSTITLQANHGNYPGASVLADGRIFIFGGSSTGAPTVGFSASEFIDPAALTTSPGPSMNWGRGMPGGTVTLADGRILVVGGVVGVTPQAAVEAYSPVSNTWSWFAPSINTHTGLAVLNNDGTVSAAPTDALGAGLTNDQLNMTLSISKGNVGTFRVVARSSSTVWFENKSAVNEVSQSNILFRSYNGVMPGDSFVVRSNVFGNANVGSFTVQSVDLRDTSSFRTTPAMADFTTTMPGTGSIPFVSVVPSVPARLIMKVMMISPDPVDQTSLVLWLAPAVTSYTSADLPIDRISAAAGCTISPADKLAFPTTAAGGADAYRYSTGLINELNLVLYGDLSDREVYPGYIAAGQVVNIEAALVRRILMSLAVRLVPGVNISDVTNLIRDAVAQVVNSAGPNPIPFSKVTDAVGEVDGVVSVVVLSPTYDVGHDTIPVQPYETPRVLNPTDIQVSLIGQ